MQERSKLWARNDDRFAVYFNDAVKVLQLLQSGLEQVIVSLFNSCSYSKQVVQR